MRKLTTVPECFGKLWDSKAVECQGGHDQQYFGPRGEKKRPRCLLNKKCRAALPRPQHKESKQEVA